MKKRITVVSLMLCVVLTLVLLGCAGDRTTRSTGEYVDDSTIANKVKVALYADQEVKGTQIEVEVFRGVVQLSGFVDSASQVQQAMRIAQGVNGVKEVRNSLIVK